MQPKLGLVLSGGGARGAYQVGVLKGISEILLKHNLNPNIRLYTGVSAGAINAAFLATHADDFHRGVDRLLELWSDLSHEQVFASDAAHMGKLAFTWATELGFGALTGTTPGKALLNTDPLLELLNKHILPDQIRENVTAGHLDALAITAVDYGSSNSITFVHGSSKFPTWNKSRRRSEKTEIGVPHVLASSAIPLLFPPAQIGDRWFGDGCVRNTQPCAPALYLGAEKLLIIGVRKRTITAQDSSVTGKDDKPPSVARVLNMLLNAVMLDGVELDVERMERVNEFVERVPETHRKQINFKKVQYLMVAPSADIGAIAAGKAHRLPRVIRYLMRGLGKIEDASEIVSYLLFDPLFCRELIEIGREDVLREQNDVLALFS